MLPLTNMYLLYKCVVILKRKPSECNINNHNASVMLAWQANMDIQYVLDAYACVMYVASYILKTEKSMGELLKHVAAEARTEELKMQMREVVLLSLPTEKLVPKKLCTESCRCQ